MKKCVIILLVIFQVIVMISCGKATKETITEPYIYPLKPGMEQWENLNMDEKIKSCKVPVKLMKQMTTEALTATVMTYPMLELISTYEEKHWKENDIDRKTKEVFIEFSGDFKGVDILKSREDGVEKIFQYMKENQLKETDHSSYIIAKYIINYIGVTEVYKYPDMSKTDSMDEKIETCRVPSELMKQMTTEALTATVMTYPMITLIDSYMPEKIADGTEEKVLKEIFRQFSEAFDGVEILKTRADAVECLNVYIQFIQETRPQESEWFSRLTEYIISYIELG